jgi:hypothetical protein
MLGEAGHLKFNISIFLPDDRLEDKVQWNGPWLESGMQDRWGGHKQNTVRRGFFSKRYSRPLPFEE